MKYFKIIFDDPPESYFAGQIVSGKVHLYLSQAKKVKHVTVKFQGKCKVHWLKTANYGKTCFSFDAEEEYFNVDIPLIEEGTENTSIPPGNHIYDFSYQLPPGVPSSFQGSKGSVQYFVVATISRSWKPAQKTSAYFTVNAIVDLNTHLKASKSASLNGSKIVPLFGFLGDCWSFTKDSVGFEVHLDRSGFVPGENLVFNVAVHNGSQSKITDITATILQLTTFRAQEAKEFERKEVITVSGPKGNAGESFGWPVLIRIPAIPPTNLGGAGVIISVYYYLKISISVGTLLGMLIQNQVPITIGTVPFQHTFEELKPASHFSQNQQPSPSAPIDADTQGFKDYGNLAILLKLDEYPDLPPPTYAEAMNLYEKHGLSASESRVIGDNERSETEVDEAGEGRPFAPRYATYAWGVE